MTGDEPNQEATSAKVLDGVAEQRARATLGLSDRKIYESVNRAIRAFHQGRGTLVDVGCGAGVLRAYLLDSIDHYIGVDILRYESFPAEATFRAVNLDSGRIDLADAEADVVACVETIEHVENPRALVRELVRLVRPGGLILVTTPNQLSLLGKLCLLLKNQFPAFQERPGLYPAHITALLATDLERIAKEAGLVDAVIRYTDSGRIPGTSRSWPSFMKGRAFSDNVLLLARRPL